RSGVLRAARRALRGGGAAPAWRGLLAPRPLRLSLQLFRARLLPAQHHAAHERVDGRQRGAVDARGGGAVLPAVAARGGAFRARAAIRARRFGGARAALASGRALRARYAGRGRDGAGQAVELAGVGGAPAAAAPAPELSRALRAGDRPRPRVDR